MQDRPGPFTLREGAAALGISLNTLRRRIATGQVRAERAGRPQGFVWQVHLDGAAPSQDGANETVQRDRPGTVHQPATALAQAEAMATYTRSILEPLVARLAEQEVIIRDQAEAIGRLEERLAPAPPAAAPQRPQAAGGAPNPPDPAPEPSPPPEPFSWPLPSHPTIRALAPWLVLLALVAVVVLLAWPA